MAIFDSPNTARGGLPSTVNADGEVWPRKAFVLLGGAIVKGEGKCVT